MVGAFCIDLLGIGCHDIGSDVAHDIQHAAVAVQCVSHVLRCLGIFVAVGKVTFLQFHDARHQGAVFQFKLDFLIIRIEIHIVTSSVIYCSACNT